VGVLDLESDRMFASLHTVKSSVARFAAGTPADRKVFVRKTCAAVRIVLRSPAKSGWIQGPEAGSAAANCSTFQPRRLSSVAGFGVSNVVVGATRATGDISGDVSRISANIGDDMPLTFARRERLGSQRRRCIWSVVHGVVFADPGGPRRLRRPYGGADGRSLE